MLLPGADWRGAADDADDADDGKDVGVELVLFGGRSTTDDCLLPSPLLLPLQVGRPTSSTRR